MIEFLGIVIGFGLLIVWHELGHFLAALSVGIKPSVFSIGFGRRIWGVNINDIDFRISALPLGGYVRFEDEGPAGIPQTFYKKPLWERLWVVFAGPLFSFILGPILAFILSAYSGELSIYTTKVYKSKTQLFQRGDSILSINKRVAISGEEVLSLLRGEGEKRVEILRGGKKKILTLKGDYSDSIELRILPIVGSTVKGFPAYRKLKRYDWIAKVDTVVIFSWQQIVDYVKDKKEGDTVSLIVYRDGKRLNIKLPVKESGEGGRLGIYVYYNKKWPPSFSKILDKTLFLTKKFSLLIYEGLKKLVSGEIKPQEGIGGPLTIGAIMAEAATSGFDVWLSILIVITINLAILNLLPIPGLDGGHILFMIVDEIYLRITKRRIPERAMIWILMFGIFIIISLIVFAIGLDIHRLLTGKLGNMLK